MRSLRFLGFVLVVSLPLCAQQQKLNERQLGAYHGDDEAVRSAMSYCDAVDNSLQGQPPQIFGELNTSPTTEANTYWREFASKQDWEAGGKPAPLAFVWKRDGAVIRVTIVSRPPRVGAPAFHRSRIDYCYGTDARLVRIRAVWSAPTYCEFLFPCRLINDQVIFREGRPAVTDWVFRPDGAIQKLRNGNPEMDYFDPSYSLTARELHLRTSADLPFEGTGPK